MAFFRYFVILRGVFSLFRLFAWRFFVISLFRVALFRLFAWRYFVISLFCVALFRGKKTKRRNGTNQPPYMSEVFCFVDGHECCLKYINCALLQFAFQNYFVLLA